MACISSAGYLAAGVQQGIAITLKATADAAIEIAIALWERNASKSIANMQNELADRQTKLAEQVHAHAILFWPAETALVNDVFGEAKAVTSYSTLAVGWGTLADVETAAGREAWIAEATARCSPPVQCEDARWQRNAQVVRSDLMSYAARQDENRTQVLNDRRFARQYAVLGLARGQLQSLLSYQSISGAIGTNASEMLISTVNSAMTAFGFYSNRIDVKQWGAGTRDTWNQSQSVLPEVQSLSRVETPKQVRLTPVNDMMLQPPPRLQAKQPMTKATEFQDLGSDLQKMGVY